MPSHIPPGHALPLQRWPASRGTATCRPPSTRRPSFGARRWAASGEPCAVPSRLTVEWLCGALPCQGLAAPVLFPQGFPLGSLTNTCMCPTPADRLGAAQGAEPHRAQRARLRAGQACSQEEGGGGAGVEGASRVLFGCTCCAGAANQLFSCAWPLPTMAHPASVPSIQLLLLSGSLLLLLPLQCSAMCHMYLYCTLISYLAIVTLDAQGAVGAAVGGSGHGRAGTLCIAIYALLSWTASGSLQRAFIAQPSDRPRARRTGLQEASGALLHFHKASRRAQYTPDCGAGLAAATMVRFWPQRCVHSVPALSDASWVAH